MDTSFDRVVWSTSLGFVNTGFSGLFSSPENFSTVNSPTCDSFRGVPDGDYLAQASSPRPQSSTEGARPQTVLKRSASGDGDGSEDLYIISSSPPAKRACVQSKSSGASSFNKILGKTQGGKPNPKRLSNPESKSKLGLRTATRKTAPSLQLSASWPLLANGEESTQAAAAMHKRIAQHTHNMVEKRYRNRLNSEFELLLAALRETGCILGDRPSGGKRNSEARRLSKAEVLDSARHHIHVLEADKKKLETERDVLLASLEAMRQ